MENANLPQYVHQPYHYKPIQSQPFHKKNPMENLNVSQEVIVQSNVLPPAQMPTFLSPAAPILDCKPKWGSDLGAILVLYILLVIILKSSKLCKFHGYDSK